MNTLSMKRCGIKKYFFFYIINKYIICKGNTVT